MNTVGAILAVGFYFVFVLVAFNKFLTCWFALKPQEWVIPLKQLTLHPFSFPEHICLSLLGFVASFDRASQTFSEQRPRGLQYCTTASTEAAGDE